MPHPLIHQLRFTRSEFQRALEGLAEADAQRQMPPMNCISWMVGHLAWQEQRYWLQWLQGKVLLPELNERFCWGCPPLTPPLGEMQLAWRAVTSAADPFLDSLTSEDLLRIQSFQTDTWSFTTSTGNLMQRVIYHYWYHTGECMAIRQMLGHTGLPEFVGDIDSEAPYRAE